MNVKNFFRRGFIALLGMILALSAAVVSATVKLYTVSSEDYPSEVESMDISKQRALDKAVKKAKKEAGIYLRTYSRSVNSELTDDEIIAITSNSYKIVGEPKYTREIVKHSDETSIIVWKVNVDVQVDDSEIQSWLKRDDKEKSTIIAQTREANKDSDENERKIEDLRKKYNRATSQNEKNSIRKQMDIADRIFSAQQKLEEGNKSYYNKDYNSAIKLYNEALEFGEYANVYYNIGTCYLNLRDYNSAIQSFEKAILLNPNFGMAYHNRGVAYMDGLDKQERAIKDFDKAIEFNPNDAGAYYNRGNAYKRLGYYERAIKDYTKSIDLNPNDPDVYCNRGVAYSQNGQIKQSMQDFSKALALNPNDAEVYSNRGVDYLRLGQYEQAIHDFDKAIAINPNYATVYSDRGTAYLKLQRYDRAIQDYDKAINLNPNSAEIYTNRGVAHAMSMNFKQAIADAMKAIQINPNYSKAYQLRGICYQQLGDNEKAQADFAKAKQLGFNG